MHISQGSCLPKLIKRAENICFKTHKILDIHYLPCKVTFCLAFTIHPPLQALAPSYNISLSAIDL